MKRVLLWAAALLIVASWIVNVFLYRSAQMPKLLFLEHRIEVENSPGSSFVLKYLENKDSERHLTTIVIKELPSAKISYTPQDVQYIHQQLGKITIQIIDPLLDEAGGPFAEPFKIRNVQVGYSDGTTENAEVGEITILPSLPVTAEYPFNWLSGGSSNDNSGFDSFQLSKELQLTEISSSYLKELSGVLSISLQTNAQRYDSSQRVQAASNNSMFALDGLPVSSLSLPFKLHMNHPIKLSYQFSFADEDKQPFTYRCYQLNLVLGFEDEAGSKWNWRQFINYTPNLSESQVKAIIRDRKEKL